MDDPDAWMPSEMRRVTEAMRPFAPPVSWREAPTPPPGFTSARDQEVRCGTCMAFMPMVGFAHKGHGTCETHRLIVLDGHVCDRHVQIEE